MPLTNASMTSDMLGSCDDAGAAKAIVVAATNTTRRFSPRKSQTRARPSPNSHIAAPAA